MNCAGTARLFYSTLVIGLLWSNILGQATYHVAKSYEDTVRVVVLWNDPAGDCPNDLNGADPTAPLGKRTRDTVLTAITRANGGTVGIPAANIKTMRTDTATWAKVHALWGGDTLPHTIVHVNAGWVTYDVTNGNAGLPDANPGPYAIFEALLDSAMDHKIGIVEIGDDAAWLSTRTFGFRGVQNSAAPMWGAERATCCRDSLWIGLLRTNDERTKVWNPRQPGTLAYPGLNGIISNTVDSILRVPASPTPNLYFKDFVPGGRCNEDADKYNVAFPAKTTFLGYQQGYANGNFVGNVNEFTVIVAIQDTTTTPAGWPVIRRAVSLSYQPQALRQRGAEQQITYDAIMFSSLTHMLDVPSRLIIIARNDSLIAGDTLGLKAYVLNQVGDTIFDPTTLSRIVWSQDPAYQRPGDRFVTSSGDSVGFTATVAWRSAHLTASLTLTNGTIVDTTIIILIKPNQPDHLVIEASSNPLVVSPNADNPLGGPTKTVTIGPTQTQAAGYAVLRDRFQNYYQFSNPTTWGSSQTGIITATGDSAAIGKGVFAKVGPAGTARVGARDNGTGRIDSITVIVSSTTYDSLRIMRFDRATNRLVQIFSLSLSRSDSTSLYVQGLRTDRVPTNGIYGPWEDISGNWSISSNLHTSRVPPVNQNSWSFSPLDTGAGTISVVSLAGRNNTQIQTQIPVVFLPGLPNSIAIYTQAGAPVAPNLLQRAAPLVADTAIAGTPFTRLYAKLFDGTIWLRTYEDSAALGNQIMWSVTPLDETSLVPPNGSNSVLTTTQAYRLVQVTAALNSISYSILLWVKAGAPTHLVIEASATIQDYANDQPLAQLVIPANQTAGSAYAILRDRYGNFVDYSRTTRWKSTDTVLFSVDTGLTSVGEGVVFRRADSGTAPLIALNTTYNFSDTVPVVLNSIYYKSLRMYILNNGPRYIDSVKIKTDSSLTLYVEGERSDGRGWDNVPATWAVTAGLKTRTQPPNWLDNWNVMPDSAGRGWIKATRNDAGSDSVYAIFESGSPNSMVLYRRTGAPAPMLRFPAVDTIAAGMTDSIVAKLFDRNGEWLSKYENIALSRNVISWSIQKLSGPTSRSDTLLTKAGHSTSFRPHIAYSLYLVTATYQENGITLTASAQIYVKPGPAHHLVIEATSDITGALLHGDYPFSPIDFGANTINQYAYAIIRDIDSNFVSLSTSTNWQSLNTSLITAAEGVAANLGQGAIKRIGTLGQTRVWAQNRQNANLFDTVDVRILSFNYDSIRIVDVNTQRIMNLQMRSDMDTVLIVQARQSFDSSWVNVSGNWIYSATLGSQSQPNQNQWRFKPTDTGHGSITVSQGSLSISIPVTILPGLPARLVLYPRPGSPVGMLPLPDPSQLIAVSAGTAYGLAAKILDWRGVYLAEYDTGSAKQTLINWTAASRGGSDLSSQLSTLTGAADRFLPTRAFDSVFITAGFRYNNTAILLSDTIQLSVGPGAPHHIVLEKSYNYNRYRPNPCDTLVITERQRSGSVYAILRDLYNNVVVTVNNGYAQVALWASLDTTVGARFGNSNVGEGVATRKVQTDTAKIYAVDVNGFTDTCVVALLAYSYDSLRIIAGNDIVPLRHSVLTMNTNQDTTLRVQGLRSDTALWVDVDGTWQNSTNLSIDPSASVGKSWKFSPSDTGTGWIKVTYPGAVGDSLPVRFKQGPPWRVTIEIITPPEKRIAGDTILTVVKVYDKDGNLVRGSFTVDTSAFHDSLGRGGQTKPRPYIMVDNDTTWLDGAPWDWSKETFTGGVDTLPFFLFNAPLDTADSMHQISISLKSDGKTINATTNPFALHPGTLSSIRIENPNQTPIGDTLVLNYPSGATLVAYGYDRFGNRIGPVPSDWNATESLHQPSPSQNTSSVFYSSNVATKNESGYLIVSKGSIKDSVFVDIQGPAITLVKAVTGDANGNGYLDQMTLYFSRPVTLPAGYKFNGLLIINPTGSGTYDTIRVDGVLNNTGRTDSVWVVSLKELQNDKPQTGWKPVVILPAQPSIEVAKARTIAIDGAGPVIWSVTKYLNKDFNHAKDTVVVVFSEPVKLNDGNSISSASNPSQMFSVWEKSSSPPPEFVMMPDMLRGITTLDPSSSPDRIKFYMSNNNNLTHNDWLKIDSINKYVTDTNSNLANSNNRRVQVIVRGQPGGLTSFPNPAVMTLRHVAKPGDFDIINQNDAPGWVLNEKAGVVLQFDVPIPSIETEPNLKVECMVRVYDAAGNVVQSKTNPEFLKSYDRSDLTAGGVLLARVYWNGANEKGMCVAAGVYRVVVYLRYSGLKDSHSYSDRKKVCTVGFSR